MLAQILYTYIAAACLFACRLLWHIALKMDHFDWQHSRNEIWGSFAFWSVAWPLVLFEPQYLINPRPLLISLFDVTEKLREEARLEKNPPPCGTQIRFSPCKYEHEPTFGEFLLETSDVKSELRHRITKTMSLIENQEGAIWNWVKGADESLTVPQDVPAAWGRFEYLADTLTREGKARVHCKACRCEYQPGELKFNDDPGKPGWNYNRILCPQGHKLLVIEAVHLSC